jgi:hypothetical protein
MSWAEVDGQQLDNAVAVGSFPGWVAITPAPLDEINQIIAAVQALITAGTLNGGQGNALLGPSQRAEAFLNSGQPMQAINQLQGFITNVQGFISGGVLTPAQGQPLIAAANAVIHALGG